MNAADVLADAWPTVDGADDFAAALLAHGEQGVAILPDGTLWALERDGGSPWYSLNATLEAGE